MKLKNLLKLPRKSISCFINNDSKSVYLFYSSGTLSYLINSIQLIRTNRHSCSAMCQEKDSLEFKVLETFDQYRGNDYGRFKLKHWKQHFQDNGFKLYKEVKPLELTIKQTLVNDSQYSRNYKVFLYLSSKRHKVFINKFNSFKECDTFLINKSIEDLLKLLK